MPVAPPDPIVEAVSNSLNGTVATGGGVLAVILGWFGFMLRRVFGFTIPRLSKSFEDALREERAMFREELREQRKDFREELQDIVKGFRESVSQDRAELGGKIDKLTTTIEIAVKGRA